MNNISESPFWREIEERVAHDHRQFRHTIGAITIATALHALNFLGPTLWEAAQSQISVARDSVTFMQRPPHPSAQPEEHPLFSTTTVQIDLTQKQVDAILANIKQP